jgi:hypothetical protein
MSHHGGEEPFRKSFPKAPVLCHGWRLVAFGLDGKRSCIKSVALFALDGRQCFFGLGG